MVVVVVSAPPTIYIVTVISLYISSYTFVIVSGITVFVEEIFVVAVSILRVIYVLIVDDDVSSVPIHLIHQLVDIGVYNVNYTFSCTLFSLIHLPSGIFNCNSC